VVLGGFSCGKKGPPLPPEPRGPLPPTQVVARQVGGRAEVYFSVPPARGNRPSQQLLRAELIRVTYSPGVEAPPDPDAFRRRGERVAAVERDALPQGARLILSDSGLDRLPGGAVGYTLRYAVRVRDRRGRPSPLVVAEDLVPLAPPGPPQGLRAEPTADGVRLVWRAPSEEGTFKYNIYRSLADGVRAESPLNTEPLTSGEFLDSEVTTGEHYLYMVRVALADGAPPRESAGSDSFEVVAEDRFAPAPPQGLVGVQEGAAVRLFWNPNRERDLAGYRLYRRVNDAGWDRIGPDPVEQPLYLDEDVRFDQRLEYRVTAIDRTDPPNEGSPSAAVEVVVLKEPATPSEVRP
jgi:hypothetical protein